MLTVDYKRLGLVPGERILDMGCGAGRHAFESFRRGGHVVALDQDDVELKNVAGLFVAMDQCGEAPVGARAVALRGDALNLPFSDGAFDRIIASEVLEHIPDDRRAMSELSRVLAPGGTIAVTVPRFYPELVNWAFSTEYHDVPGGHVRIYRRQEVYERLSQVGLKVTHHHYAHGLHSPYWWLKCAVGVSNNDNFAVAKYRQFLEWEIIKAPKALKSVSKIADPALGKSIVFYATKES
ncbi:MAG: class I SAM-dependent methyltransferase [Acidimicrobiales bacterium]|nr:class I SAM-dependent methyltransferase [Acidimicrobiales bacterium]